MRQIYSLLCTDLRNGYKISIKMEFMHSGVIDLPDMRLYLLLGERIKIMGFASRSKL